MKDIFAVIFIFAVLWFFVFHLGIFSEPKPAEALPSCPPNPGCPITFEDVYEELFDTDVPGECVDQWIEECWSWGIQ